MITLQENIAKLERMHWELKRFSEMEPSNSRYILARKLNKNYRKNLRGLLRNYKRLSIVIHKQTEQQFINNGFVYV